MCFVAFMEKASRAALPEPPNAFHECNKFDAQ